MNLNIIYRLLGKFAKNSLNPRTKTCFFHLKNVIDEVLHQTSLNEVLIDVWWNIGLIFPNPSLQQNSFSKFSTPPAGIVKNTKPNYDKHFRNFLVVGSSRPVTWHVPWIHTINLIHRRRAPLWRRWWWLLKASKLPPSTFHSVPIKILIEWIHSTH